MNLFSALARLVDAIEAAPNFPFGADLSRAQHALQRWLPPDECARHLRTLINGARATPSFPFGADVEAAEQALAQLAPLPTPGTAAPGNHR